MRAIQRRVGDNPLHLDTFLSYISLRIENENIPDAYWEEYISNYPLETIDHVIFMLIDRLTRTLPQTKELFFLLGILGGHAPIYFLELCLEQSVESTLDDLATKTSLVWRGQETIYISHSLYLAAIQKYDYISVFNQQSLAEQILHNLDKLHLDTFHRETIRIESLQILNAYKEASTYAYNLARMLFQDGQFQTSCRYYTIARECLERTGKDLGECLFHCMLGQISSKLQLENFTAETMRQELEDCKDTLKHSTLPKEAFQKCLTEYLIAENQFLHYLGEFHESLNKVKEILSILYRSKCSDIELIGSMWAEYAIAVKETSSLENALETFRKATNICPDSKNLRFEHMTHLSERY